LLGELRDPGASRATHSGIVTTRHDGYVGMTICERLRRRVTSLKRLKTTSKVTESRCDGDSLVDGVEAVDSFTSLPVTEL
jgi:hypothetical protein